MPLKIAIGSYGRTAALKSGAVSIAGIQPDFIEVKLMIAAFRRMACDLELEVCEMAFATFMIAREAGLPLKALPVFTFRRFHHRGCVALSRVTWVVDDDIGRCQPKHCSCVFA